MDAPKQTQIVRPETAEDYPNFMTSPYSSSPLHTQPPCSQTVSILHTLNSFGSQEFDASQKFDGFQESGVFQGFRWVFESGIQFCLLSPVLCLVEVARLGN